MNKILLVSLLCLVSLKYNSIAQTRFKHEIGAFAGASYYMGEINPANQFYSPSPSVGLIYKMLIDRRSSLGARVYYGHFKGSDRDFNNPFQQSRNASFSASLLDINALYEFNFLPFSYNARKRVFTPILFVGLGYEIKLQSQSNIGNHFSVPFGVGIKYLVSRKVTAGAEWSFRKTFRDNIDGIENPGESRYKSTISNTDWYSFGGIFITFRLFDRSGDCPAYQ